MYVVSILNTTTLSSDSIGFPGPGSPPIAVKANQATPSFLGSLIVILPSNFKGGQLLLRQSERECSYDFKSSHMHSNDRVTVSWVAFLKGVEQHVRPVSEGYRIVLTYVSSISSASKLYRRTRYIESLQIIGASKIVEHWIFESVRNDQSGSVRPRFPAKWRLFCIQADQQLSRNDEIRLLKDHPSRNRLGHIQYLCSAWYERGD